MFEVGAAFGGELVPFLAADDAGPSDRFGHLGLAFAFPGQEDRDRCQAVDGVLDGGEVEALQRPWAVALSFLGGEFGDLVVGERVPDGGLGGGLAGKPVDEGVELAPRQPRRAAFRPVQVTQVVLGEIVVDVAFECLGVLGDDPF